MSKIFQTNINSTTNLDLTFNSIAMQSTSCLGVILAGGLSSRMGQDKSQLMHSTAKISMLEYSRQLLKNSGIEHTITSGDNHQIADIIPQTGPVGGIYSVLSHFSGAIQPKGLLILPVDLPLMSPKALTELRLKGELSQKATFFKDAEGNNHHIPLYLPNNAYLALFLQQAFKESALAPKVGNKVNDGAHKGTKNGPSIRSMLERIPSQAILCTSSKALFNTNTPQQWQQAAQQR